MRKGPKSISQKDNSIPSAAYREFTQTVQHGRLSSPFLLLPSETLTHITSFLDLSSLLFFSQTCLKFYEHICDDNTWHRAFVCQFFGIPPESALNDFRPLTFRSTGRTWRHEFTRRNIIRRLWSLSINAPILHDPFHAPISAIHVMPDRALLSASIQYGLVARSSPFTGEVLRGYLNATGVPPGLSYDNTSIELTPNVSVCNLSSNDTTAKVIWGRRDGSVSIVSHLRTMSGTPPALIQTSLVHQEHDNAVLDGTWAANGDAFVTAGADGRVKVWTTTPFCCFWTSERHLQGLESDAIVRVVEDLDNGLVVAASRSGDIIVLSGFNMPLHPYVGLTHTQQSADILSFLPHVESSTRLSVLVCRVDSAHFYRCTLDLRSKQVTANVFGNPAYGSIRCIQPAFSDDRTEQDFVVAGTQLGFVSIYDWGNTSPSSEALLGSRHADVFANAHVTSLAINTFVIAAGSARGAIRVLDLLTLETLRSIAAPMNTDVGQIELVGEALVAIVGSQVLAWSSGRFTPGSKDTLKTKGKGKQHTHKKGFSTFWGAIFDSRPKNRLVEESHTSWRSVGPEREQLKKLQDLGLSEREAVEYTLMLSRDEELQRVQRRIEHVEEQEVFESDESSRRQSGSDPSFPLSSSPSDRHSPPLPPSSTPHRLLMPLAPPPTSNVKVQVSPRFHPEPKKAGGLPGSPSDSRYPRSVWSSPSRSRPTLGSTPSRATSSKQISTSTSTPTKQNAWRKPLPYTGSSAFPTEPSSLVTPSTPGSNWEGEAERIGRVEDLELRFALELSLAEAQSHQNQLSEQLQVLELLRKRGDNTALYDQGLGRLAEQGSRRGRLAVQDDETLMLQLVALSLVGQTRGDTVAVALDKRDASNFTFVLATNRRHTLADEDRARQFFQLAASADSERALLLFTLVSSSRKVNRRLVKLKKSIAQCLPSIKRLVHRYRWPHNDLRKRARELLPVMHVKFGEIPLPKLYVKVLNALARAVAPSIPFFDPPSNHDCDRFLDVLNMSTFMLSTRFISWSARRSVYSKPMAILERRLYKVAQYLMGATSLLDMRPTLPRKRDALPYVWAVVGGEPESVEDIFLLRTPLEVVREIDARWTESTLRAKLTNWRRWVPSSTPRIHAELRLITSCNRAILDPSLDAYDPRKPAANPHRQLSRRLHALRAVFPAGGSGKIDRNWTFALSPRERPNQDVCELVYDLLEHELDSLQDTPRRPWEVLLRSMGSWACVSKPDEVTVVQLIIIPRSSNLNIEHGLPEKIHPEQYSFLCASSLPHRFTPIWRVLEHSPEFSVPV
ncbi:hypothetical protein EDB92DRAFT_1949077 [Lactarius akahatsu]|uniref:F-box domain-containing protein n=1 Tax=Lactarius akahatsu TaxID=416441 RepID=A0AAD4LAF7_9AGAM|nr:hypothetical protein EDB92DRAFT_1949077 [Lactarius akahatsu]